MITEPRSFLLTRTVQLGVALLTGATGVKYIQHIMEDNQSREERGLPPRHWASRGLTVIGAAGLVAGASVLTYKAVTEPTWAERAVRDLDAIDGFIIGSVLMT